MNTLNVFQIFQQSTSHSRQEHNLFLRQILGSYFK